MKSTIVSIAILVFLSSISMRASDVPVGTQAVPSIELRDQFDELQTLSFPASHITLLVVADRKGAEDIEGWIPVLKDLFPEQSQIRGLANMSGVPAILQARARRSFRQTCTYPVMLDWAGSVAKHFPSRPGAANIFVLDRAGEVRGHVWGPATHDLKEKVAALVRSLLQPGRESASVEKQNRISRKERLQE
jgi:hypothetical protein